MSVKRALVYGGRGALGSACVKKFKSCNYWVGSIDLQENSDADACVVVDPQQSLSEQQIKISSEVGKLLSGEKLDAIICVAGGWAGGNAAAKEFITNSDMMWKQSVWSSLIAASLGSQHLKEGGLLTLTGAHAALSPTPGMIGYGMAKAAVHQLTKSLSAKDGGLPPAASVLAILPVTLDTPMNRKWMPKADTSTWTSLDFVSELFHKWSEGEDRPASGSLVSLITTNGTTSTEIH